MDYNLDDGVLLSEVNCIVMVIDVDGLSDNCILMFYVCYDNEFILVFV